ncbi:MAG: transposase [Paracoccaceae bacterium]|jgi:transposase
MPDYPAVLEAMITGLQAEDARISATLRVYDQRVQALRLRIAKLQNLAFGKSSEKIEREIEQLELALEDLLVAVAEEDNAPIDGRAGRTGPRGATARVCLVRHCGNAVNLVPVSAAPTVTVICGLWAKMSASCWT